MQVCVYNYMQPGSSPQTLLSSPNTSKNAASHMCDDGHMFEKCILIVLSSLLFVRLLLFLFIASASVIPNSTPPGFAGCELKTRTAKGELETLRS